MTQKDNSDPGAVHVNPVDRLGRRIDPAVLNVAEVISRRALRHAEKLLRSPGEITPNSTDFAGQISIRQVIQAGKESAHGPATGRREVGRRRQR